MPIHYTGGMEPISYGGTFTLERLVGTVPVEEDGSAYFELPALRSFFFVALDANDLSVKRMQSFLTVQPGETTSCVGCHEHRTQAPRPADMQLAALRRAPSPIQPIADVPDVIDYPRDVQPVLDAALHKLSRLRRDRRRRPARAVGSSSPATHGPLLPARATTMMTIARLISDGRNLPRSNYAPRTLGSSASRLLTLLDGTHYGVKATPHQKKLLRLWIDSGAAYPGTYAALGCGMIGNYAENAIIHTGEDWPATQAAAKVMQKTCAACHAEPARLLPQSLADERGVSFWQPSLDDPRLLTSRHIVFNLSRPSSRSSCLPPWPSLPAVGASAAIRRPASA